MKFDLNKDNKVDITDLTYVHGNVNKAKKEAIIEDTDIIVNPDNVDITLPESTNASGDVKDLLKDNGKSVQFTPKAGENGEIPAISEENPIAVPISLNKTSARSTTQVEQVVIKAPTDTAPGKGNITIPKAGENGQDLVVTFDSDN